MNKILTITNTTLQIAIFLRVKFISCYYCIMKKSIEIFEQISDEINSHRTYYTFNKTSQEDLSDKYRKGRVNVTNWASELIWLYIQKEKKFLLEFKEHITNQKNKLNKLPNKDFKKGIFDELNFIEEIVNNELNNRNK